MNKSCCARAAVFAAFLITSDAGAGIIDDFSISEESLTRSDVGSGSVTTQPHPSGVFGVNGYRTLVLDVTSSSPPATASTGVLGGIWFASNPNEMGSIARVIYGSNSGQFATLFPPGTASDTLFRATVKFADQPLSLKALLKDDGGSEVSWTWTISPIFPPSEVVVSQILGNFTLSTGTSFNFSQVTRITVEMSGPTTGWDGELGQLDTAAVPEPASLLLGLAVTGVIGLAAARRRRKQA